MWKPLICGASESAMGGAGIKEPPSAGGDFAVADWAEMLASLPPPREGLLGGK